LKSILEFRRGRKIGARGVENKGQQGNEQAQIEAFPQAGNLVAELTRVSYQVLCVGCDVVDNFAIIVSCRPDGA